MPGSSEQQVAIRSGRAGEGGAGKRPRKSDPILQTRNLNTLGQDGGGADDLNAKRPRGGTPASRSEGAGPGSSGDAQLNEARLNDEARLNVGVLQELERLVIILSCQQVETTGKRLQRAGWSVKTNAHSHRFFWWTRASQVDGSPDEVERSSHFCPGMEPGRSKQYRTRDGRKLVDLVLVSLGWKVHDRWEEWLGGNSQEGTDLDSQGELRWYLAWAERYVLEAAGKEKEHAARGDLLNNAGYRPTTLAKERKDRNGLLCGNFPKPSQAEVHRGLSALRWGNTRMLEVLAEEALAVQEQQHWAVRFFPEGGADLGSQGDVGLRQIFEDSDRWGLQISAAGKACAILATEKGLESLHECVFAEILVSSLRDGPATHGEEFFRAKVEEAAGRPFVKDHCTVRVTADERGRDYNDDVRISFSATDADESSDSPAKEKELTIELKALEPATVNLDNLLRSAIPGERHIDLATTLGYNSAAQTASSAVPLPGGSQGLTWVPPARLEQARRNGQKALHVKLPPPSEKQAALGRHLMDIRSTFVDLRNKGKCRGLAKGMVEELRKSMEALSGAILRDGLNKLQADGEIEWVEVPGPLFYLQQAEYRETVRTWLREKKRGDALEKLGPHLEKCEKVSGALGRSDLDKAVRNYQEVWRAEGLTLLWGNARCIVGLDEFSRRKTAEQRVRQQNSV